MDKGEISSIKWEILKLEISQLGQIVQFEKKLAKHIQSIEQISIIAIPKRAKEDAVVECGELSMSFNNSKDHQLHTIVGYLSKMPKDIDQNLNINAAIEPNTIITGYYRDFKQMRDQFREPMPYTVKVLLKCRIKK